MTVTSWIEPLWGVFRTVTGIKGWNNELAALSKSAQWYVDNDPRVVALPHSIAHPTIDDGYDAFRHIYSSVLTTKKYGPLVAKTLGDLNELKGAANFWRDDWSMAGTNMDMWNNALGRQIAAELPSDASEAAIANAVVQAILDGRAIVDPGQDARKSQELFLNFVPTDLREASLLTDNFMEAVFLAVFDVEAEWVPGTMNVVSTPDLPNLSGTAVADWLAGDAGNNSIAGEGGSDFLYGGAGSDVIDGGAGADRLFGEAGNDWLGYTAAGLGNESVDELSGDGNVYEGGQGNDRICGSVNKDIFVFRKGDGADYVISQGGNDELRLLPSDSTADFTRNIAESAVGFLRDGLDLLVTIGGPDSLDQVRIASWFDQGQSANALGSVTLGSKTWLKAEIESIALNAIGTEQGDTLQGLSFYRNVLQGRGGNDVLFGADSGKASTELGDTFVGGANDDDMTGTCSGDTYIYFRGDGHDSIREQSDPLAFQDEVVFPDIALSEAAFTRVGDDLKVILPGNGSVTVKNWFSSTEYRKVEFMSFSDQTLSATDITALTGVVLTEANDSYTGTAGVDIVYAMGGSDSVSGEPGGYWSNPGSNDKLFGGAGNDKLYGLGGDDELYGGADNDTLDGGLGRDLLDGGSGDDVLGGVWGSSDSGYLTYVGYVSAPGNIYVGGTGNDTLNGTVGADRYEFSRGWGRDTLIEVGDNPSLGRTTDTLVFTDVTASEVQVRPAGYDLVLSCGTDSLTLKDFFRGPERRVERVEFVSGEVWTESDLMDRALTQVGSAQSDSLTGAENQPNKLYGGGGVDYVYGRSQGDLLNGGTGNDQLSGSFGNDTYEYFAGDGYDTIFEAESYYLNGGYDTLHFKDVDVASAKFWRIGADLQIDLGGGQGVLVKNQFSTQSNPAIDLAIFGSTSMTAADLYNQSAVKTS